MLIAYIYLVPILPLSLSHVVFLLQVIAAKEAGSAAPVKNIDGNTFLYIRHKDMFFVAVSRTNANAGASHS